jgi:hypothetical protein
VYESEAKQLVVDVSNLRAGLYIIRLIGEGNAQTLKFVKN